MSLISNNSDSDNDMCNTSGTVNGMREGYENVDHVVPSLWGALILLGIMGNGFVVYVMLR